MGKIAKLVAVTVLALIGTISVLIHLFTAYQATEIYKQVVFNNGAQYGSQQLNEAIVAEFQQKGELMINLENETITLIPKNENEPIE